MYKNIKRVYELNLLTGYPGSIEGKWIMMKILVRVVPLLLLTIVYSSLCRANNMAFLDKQRIQALNDGVFEIVTPKLESDRITYARELPFDSLDYVERNEKFHSIGTAFFINDKELMTAAHVFGLMYFSLYQDFFIRDTQGNIYPVNKIRKYSTVRDMVIFDLKKYPEKITSLQLDGTVEIGDTVFSVGNAQGEGIAYRAGQVASFTPEREFGQWKDIRFTSPASPGNSGGPLLNLDGHVVGLIVKKNQSENYNIAVPITELKKLPDNAVFHIRNVRAGIYGVDDTVVRDWKCTAPLPAAVAELAHVAQDSLDGHVVALGRELSEKVKDKGFPRGKRFRDYLRNQSIIKGLAPLVPGKDFATWSVDGWLGTKIPLSAHQNVYKSRGLFTDLQLMVEKPADMSLRQFVDSPKVVMDTMLQAVSLPRRVGTENIPMTSLGEPAQTAMVEDRLGRKWVTALWNLPFDDMFVYTSCVPCPGGVMCLFDRKRNGFRKYGYFDSLKEGYDEFTVGYVGSVEDWNEYFSLGKSRVPRIFSESKMALADNKFQFLLPEYTVNFSTEKITSDSTVHMHMGYSNRELLGEDVLLFELFPVKGAKSHYQIKPYFEPGVFTEDKYKVRWHELLAHQSDFSGNPINNHGKQIIKHPVDATKRTFPAFDGTKITRMFAVGCFYEPSVKNIEKDCEGFGQSVHFISR